MCVLYGNELRSIVNTSVFMQCSLIFTHGSHTIWQWSWLQNTATSSETSPDRRRNKLTRLRSPKTAGWGERRGPRWWDEGGTALHRSNSVSKGGEFEKGYLKGRAAVLFLFFTGLELLWEIHFTVNTPGPRGIKAHLHCYCIDAYPWIMQMFHFICDTMASAVLSDWKHVGQPSNWSRYPFQSRNDVYRTVCSAFTLKNKNRKNKPKKLIQDWSLKRWNCLRDWILLRFRSIVGQLPVWSGLFIIIFSSNR